MNQKRAHEENTSSSECNDTNRLNNLNENKRRKHDVLTTKKSENYFLNNEYKKYSILEMS